MKEMYFFKREEVSSSSSSSSVNERIDAEHCKLCGKLTSYSHIHYSKNSSVQFPVRFLLAINIVCLTIRVNMCSPIRTLPEQPKWVITCRVPNSASTDSRSDEDVSELEDVYLFDKIIGRAKFSRSHANKVMQKFRKLLNNGDPTFVESTKHLTQDWLPVIGEPNSVNFQQYDTKEWLKRIFEYLQYYAVGFEQIVVDRTIGTGVMMDEFKDVESYLYQILCETHFAMQAKRVKPDADVMRDVMSREYREIEDSSRRDVRDYVILREYIKLTEFIVKLMDYLKTAAESTETTD